MDLKYTSKIFESTQVVRFVCIQSTGRGFFFLKYVMLSPFFLIWSGVTVEVISIDFEVAPGFTGLCCNSLFFVGEKKKS